MNNNPLRGVVVVTIAAVTGILAPAHDVQAAFVVASDGFGGFKNLFEVTDTVFAFGDMNKISDPGPIPLPATFPLLVSALGTVVVAARRKNFR